MIKDKTPSVYHSPYRLLIILVLSIFITEASIMIFLSLLPTFPLWLEVFIDSALLVALLSPVLYFFLIHPLVTHIAERRRAEEELRRERDFSLSVIQASPIFFVAIDPDGKVLMMNEAMLQALGYTADEVLGKDYLSNFIPEPERDILSGVFKKLIKLSKPSLNENHVLTKDGREFLVEWHGRPVFKENGDFDYLFGLGIDVTENRRAEEELRESEERYRKLVELSPDAIAVHSDGRIVFVNTAGLRLFGAAYPEQLVGKEIMEVVHPDYREVVRERVRQMREEGKIVPLIEEKFVRLDGSAIDVEVAAMPLAYQGKPAIQVVIRDITERKRAEEQLKESLKEKEVLLKEVHHRVKNNMQIISGLLMFQEDLTEDGKIIEVLKDSQSRILSMALIHERLYQSGNLSKIDLQEYIDDLVRGLFEFYGVSESRVALNMNLENVSLGIDSAIPFGLVVNELVSNSLKYAFPGDKSGEIKIFLRLADENMIELVVGDNGIGIPEDIDHRKTRSLGLYLVTLLVENQLHGEITLKRERGAEFLIKFRGTK